METQFHPLLRLAVLDLIGQHFQHILGLSVLTIQTKHRPAEKKKVFQILPT